MAIVELSKVTKRYGDVLAVQDFNLTTAEGEFVVLVGPSGCGKTTTMRMIAGLETVTGGEIKIGGKNVVGMIPRERDVAMVFQNYALFPHMNVFGNMSFGLRLRKFPKQRVAERVHSAAKILGIEHLLERKSVFLCLSRANPIRNEGSPIWGTLAFSYLIRCELMPLDAPDHLSNLVPGQSRSWRSVSDFALF